MLARMLQGLSPITQCCRPYIYIALYDSNMKKPQSLQTHPKFVTTALFSLLNSPSLHNAGLVAPHAGILCGPCQLLRMFGFIGVDRAAFGGCIYDVVLRSMPAQSTQINLLDLKRR